MRLLLFAMALCASNALMGQSERIYDLREHGCHGTFHCASCERKKQAKAHQPEQELQGITMRAMGAAPDVPWFMLPAAGFVSTPAGGGLPTIPPYIQLPGAATIAGDSPSNVPGHANVMRHWNGATPNYQIVLPPNVTLSSSVAQTFATNGGPNASYFAALPPNVQAYTWQNFATAINQAFATYSGVATSLMVATQGPNVTADYTTAGGATIPQSFINGTTLTWSTQFGGPTGNNLNEIVLTDLTAPGIGNFPGFGAPNPAATIAGGGVLTNLTAGFASMLAAPQLPINGAIAECDIVINAQMAFLAIVVTGTQANFTITQATLPEEWTTIRHEVGHFLGLDHTNLHPGGVGQPPFAAGVLAGPPVGGTAGTQTIFDWAGVTAPFTSAGFSCNPPGGAAAPASYALPGMTSSINHTGVGSNHAATPIHRDDAVSLSKIYPVGFPGQVAGKLPLINCSGRIFGRQRNANTPIPFAVQNSGSPQGVFGRNIMAIPETSAGGNGVFPVSGTISGTARLAASEGPLLAIYQRTGIAIPHCDPTIQSANTVAPRFPVLGSTLGSQNANPGFGLAQRAPTGGFSLEGLQPGSYNDFGARAVELVFENLEQLGAGAAFGEWFSNQPGLGAFYTGNPLSSPLLPNSVAMRSFLGHALGAANSSLRLVPGTVIALDPCEHDESNLIGTGPQYLLNQTSAAGSNFDILLEQHGRPIVDIQPRNGRTSNWIRIRAKTVFPGLGLDQNFGQWQLAINNTVIPFNTWVNWIDQTQPTILTANTLDISLRMPQVLAGQPTTAGTTITFMIGGTPLVGFLVGRTGWGRNDVIY